MSKKTKITIVICVVAIVLAIGIGIAIAFINNGDKKENLQLNDVNTVVIDNEKNKPSNVPSVEGEDVFELSDEELNGLV